jgi:hypothetical protein
MSHGVSGTGEFTRLGGSASLGSVPTGGTPSSEAPSSSPEGFL